MSSQPFAPLAVVVGRNCKRIRSDIGITQDELARYARSVGLHWNAAKAGNFEAGRSAPTFATVLAVTIALQMATQDRNGGQGVTLADLVAGYGFVALTDTLDTVPTGWVADVCRGRASTWPPADDYWQNVWPTQEIESGVLERRATRTAALVRQAATQLAEVGKLDVAERSGLTEHRLAQRLGISRERLADISYRLWNGTFSEVRDHRAGPDANQQKKGRISRELRTELEKALADGND
ncbi:helix-turn-helix domain-containing protein [Mycobacterium bohemicum]|uniref:helix-turn-helix domain-containing protein n=1 Tax=Mycobacterium bohemicum TaxID=56425 RepID=UPI0011124B39|nr:helix-turn-helix transcriptional regulator [Mycobacterium bohemicum]MCV6968987.1 helix-turn-helix transcriptional regulator [Mycobacterium bohemicum]